LKKLLIFLFTVSSLQAQLTLTNGRGAINLTSSNYSSWVNEGYTLETITVGDDDLVLPVPTIEIQHPEGDVDIPVDPETNLGTGSTELTNVRIDELIDIVNSGDQDNDVPTLLEILARLDSFQEENTDLLQQLVDANDPDDSSSLEDLDVSADQAGLSTKLPEEQISDLLNNAGGTLPNTSMQVGNHYFSFDLLDPKFATALLIAKAGLTSLIVVGSFTTTWKLSSILIST
tara:strand:+ start:547 stop:1239 length:693 start_codon:yes stop_codon:yes gene_type:complete